MAVNLTIALIQRRPLPPPLRLPRFHWVALDGPLEAPFGEEARLSALVWTSGWRSSPWDVPRKTPAVRADWAISLSHPGSSASFLPASKWSLLLQPRSEDLAAEASATSCRPAFWHLFRKTLSGSHKGEVGLRDFNQSCPIRQQQILPFRRERIADCLLRDVINFRSSPNQTLTSFPPKPTKSRCSGLQAATEQRMGLLIARVGSKLRPRVLCQTASGTATSNLESTFATATTAASKPLSGSSILPTR